MATKKLFARVKANQKLARMILFSGHEFIKGEFRRVPAGSEDQAKKDDRIETKLQDAPDIEEAPVVEKRTAPAPETILIKDEDDEEQAETEGEDEGEEDSSSDDETESAAASDKPKSRRGNSQKGK